ncbi:MAG: winged helix-turn-helix domain-containing protein [Burkholderiaceae bacterium]|nr:winged helix-turn-helix domain-containing protein [Burkholderiaceae bacterium]
MRGADFVLGDWTVLPGANRLECGDQLRQVEPRAMDVLVALCERPGEVLSAEDLLTQCWGDAPLGDNPVHKTIAQLRRALGDSATEPRYIETIRKRGYRAVAAVRSLDGGIEQAREGAWTGGSPFRGLLAFDEAHAQVFYGREQATQALLQCAHQQLLKAQGLCLVLGPSGSGKTSLVLAGLFPALQRPEGFEGWRALSSTSLDLGDVGAQSLTTALAAALLDWELGEGRPMFPGASASSLAAHLQDGMDMVLSEIDWALRREMTEALQPLQLLLIDRLETLFVAPQFDEAQRQGFLDTLQALARGGRVLVVAACRNDFYPRLAEYPQLMANKAQGAHFDLAPPTRAEITQMIRLPARAAGLSFGFDPATQTRLDDVLCDDAAHSPDALPLLQYTLEELYRQRGPQGELSFEAYRALGGQPGGSAGGLEGAIGLRAESLIAALLPIQQEALPHVLSLLVMLSGDESRVTSRRALWAELRGPAERELVQALVDARLLVSDLIDGQAGFRVAHEAILRRWPRVTDWIAAHLQALQLRSRLRLQVQRWLDEGRSAEYLLPKGKQLTETRELLQRVEFSFGPAEQDFVQTSLRRARLGERLRLSAVIGIAALAVLAGTLAWRANRAEQIAQQRSTEADDLVGYMLGDFADKLRPIGRLELLDSVGAKALDHLRTAPITDSHGSLQRAKALTVIGEVRVSRRELDAALPPLQAAGQLLSAQAPEGPLAIDWRKAQGTAAFWTGHVHYSKRQFEQARAAFEDYRRHSAAWLEAAPTQPEAQVELSYAQNTLGTLMLHTGDLPGATQQFRQSIALKQQVLQQRPQNLTLRAEWADSMTWLGSALLWQGEFQQARLLFADGLQGVVNARASAPKDLEWVYREALAHWWLGNAWQRLRRSADAHSEWSNGLALTRELLQQEPKNRRWRLMQARLELASASAQTGNTAALAPRLRELADELAGLDKGALSGTAPERLPLRVQLQLALARSLQSQGQRVDALRLLDELLPVVSGAVARRPEDLRLRVEHGRLRLALAAAQPKNPAAQTQCAAVLNDFRELGPLLRVHLDITDVWIQAHSCLGQSGQVLREQEWLSQRIPPGV